MGLDSGGMGPPGLPGVRPNAQLESLTEGGTLLKMSGVVELMNNLLSFRKALLPLVMVMAGATGARGQITISSADMFNQVGQWYEAYANANGTTVQVAAMLGTTGGPQAWDFTTGPQDVTYRFDYLAATNVAVGADFAALGAQIAEQKTDEADTTSQSWLFFKQDAVKGRLDYGFYDPTFSASQPEATFTNALQDFPATIHYGDAWNGATVFYSSESLSGFDIPEEFIYTSTDKVDAYGFITLPTIGFVECLRVHETVEYDLYADLGSGYTSFGSAYVLNYYWLAPNLGIVAQITSAQSDQTPPDDLPSGASALVVMFAANHPTNSTPAQPTTIKGFKFTLGKTSALLQWTALSTVNSYTVQYATTLSPANWQPLGSTTNNFLIDTTANSPAAPIRFYRVVGIGPK